MLDIEVNFAERERERKGRLGRDQNCNSGSPDISRGVGREDQQNDLYFPPCLISSTWTRPTSRNHHS